MRGRDDEDGSYPDGGQVTMVGRTTRRLHIIAIYICFYIFRLGGRREGGREGGREDGTDGCYSWADVRRRSGRREIR